MTIEGLGKKFQEARLARKLTLDEAARMTKIRPSRLAEIEADDFSQFPSLAYAKGLPADLRKIFGSRCNTVPGSVRRFGERDGRRLFVSSGKSGAEAGAHTDCSRREKTSIGLASAGRSGHLCDWLLGDETDHESQAARAERETMIGIPQASPRRHRSRRARQLSPSLPLRNRRNKKPSRAVSSFELFPRKIAEPEVRRAATRRPA